MSDIEGTIKKNTAEWLRSNGYLINIDALSGDDDDDEKWRVSINGYGRQYAKTLGEAVEQFYQWAIQEPHSDSLAWDCEGGGVETRSEALKLWQKSECTALRMNIDQHNALLKMAIEYEESGWVNDAYSKMRKMIIVTAAP